MEAVSLIVSLIGSLIATTSQVAVQVGRESWRALADLLKRKHKLVDLKISLDSSGSEPKFLCELEVERDGEPQTLKSWEAPVSAIGMPDRFDRSRTHYAGYPFNLPEGVAEGLRNQLDKLSFDGTLWLHLARPYGYLGLVPWETLLRAHIQVPIVRLPNFIVPAPLESRSTLDVLICASSPVAKVPIDVNEHLHAMIPRIREFVPRKVKIHVFTDQFTFSNVRPTDFGPDVTFYPPSEASGYAPSSPSSTVPDDDRLSNPWLLWMRDALKGRSIDIAHFVCHGFMSIDRGALAFAESPIENEDRTTARFIGTAELTTFLTQIGAWGVGFSSPPYNFSEMGLRLFADTVALLRPLFVLHHDLVADSGCVAMGQVYKLFTSPVPEVPPASGSIFIYCQPYRVKGQPQQPEKGVRPAFAQAAPDLEKLVQQYENVPGWIAASQRYIEQCQWQLRKAGEEGAAEGSDSKRIHQEAVHDALRDIQKVVANVATGGNS